MNPIDRRSNTYPLEQHLFNKSVCSKSVPYFIIPTRQSDTDILTKGSAITPSGYRVSKLFSSLEPTPSNLYNNVPPPNRGFIKGLIIGAIVPSLVNSLEKLETLIQLNRLDTKNMQTIISKNPLLGTRASVLYGMTKHVTLWGGISYSREFWSTFVYNPAHSQLLAETTASTALGYTTSIWGVIRANMYANNERTMLGAWSAIPTKNRLEAAFAGSFTSAARQAIHWLTYFSTTRSTLAKIQQLRSSTDQNTLDNFIAGAIGGGCAAGVSYPLRRITTLRRVEQELYLTKHTYQIFFQITTKEGPLALWKGFARAGLPKIVIAGALTNAISKLFDKQYATNNSV